MIFLGALESLAVDLAPNPAMRMSQAAPGVRRRSLLACQDVWSSPRVSQSRLTRCAKNLYRRHESVGCRDKRQHEDPLQHLRPCRPPPERMQIHSRIFIGLVESSGEMSAYAIGIVSIFMAVGPALMILNKEILDKVDFRVSAELSAQVPREQGARQPALGCATATEVKELWPQHPILVSSMGLVASGIFTHVLYGLGKLRLEHANTVTLRFWVTRCLPVGVCHAATLAFGNAQYLFMGISSVQVLKSFTPIVTAGVTFVLLGRKESLRSSAALLALCVATATAARGDSSVTAFGLMLALTGSLAEATRLVMTDFLLSGVKMQVLESMYYLAPAGGLCLLALGTLLEGPSVVARGDQAKIWANPLVFFIAALLGVGVQLLTTAVIQATSATTLKVGFKGRLLLCRLSHSVSFRSSTLCTRAGIRKNGEGRVRSSKEGDLDKAHVRVGGRACITHSCTPICPRGATCDC